MIHPSYPGTHYTCCVMLPRCLLPPPPPFHSHPTHPGGQFCIDTQRLYNAKVGGGGEEEEEEEEDGNLTADVADATQRWYNWYTISQLAGGAADGESRRSPTLQDRMWSGTLWGLTHTHTHTHTRAHTHTQAQSPPWKTICTGAVMSFPPPPTHTHTHAQDIDHYGFEKLASRKLI